MKRTSWLVIGVFVLGLAAMLQFAAAANAQQGWGEGSSAGPMQTAQLPAGGPGGQDRPGAMNPAEMEKMRQQMLERMLDESGLTAKEQAAAKETLMVKQQARRTLEDELTKLRRLANKSKPTDQELKDALAAYRAAMAKYRAKVEKADAGLIKQLSLKGQVRCMSLGVLDNGLGPMGPGRGPDGGRRGRSGFGPPSGGFGGPR